MGLTHTICKQNNHHCVSINETLTTNPLTTNNIDTHNKDIVKSDQYPITTMEYLSTSSNIYFNIYFKNAIQPQ